MWFWRGSKQTVIRHMEKPVLSMWRRSHFGFKSCPLGPWEKQSIQPREPEYLHTYACTHPYTLIWKHACSFECMAFVSIFLFNTKKQLQAHQPVLQSSFCWNLFTQVSLWSNTASASRLQEFNLHLYYVLMTQNHVLRVKLLESMANCCWLINWQ